MSMAPRIRPSSMWSRGSKSNSRGVPTRLDHGVVVLAAGRRLVGGQVGDRPSAPSCHSASAAVWAASACLDLGGQRLGLREQRLLLVALGLRDQLAGFFCSPRLARIGDRLAPGGVGGEARSTSRRTAALGLAARTRSGSSRRNRGSIMVARRLLRQGRSSPEIPDTLRHTCPGNNTYTDTVGIPWARTVRAPRS